MVGAVWVRRYGPRGFALGMVPSCLLLHPVPAGPASQVPWLLSPCSWALATLLLRGVVFAERPARTLRRLVTAFRARAYA